MSKSLVLDEQIIGTMVTRRRSSFALKILFDNQILSNSIK